ncbi:MAG: hypothetical protein AAF317_04865 [Pseudomonadota bacterium]
MAHEGKQKRETEPEITGAHTPLSRQDFERYKGDLDPLQCTDEEAEAFLSALYQILQSFVDLGFTIPRPTGGRDEGRSSGVVHLAPETKTATDDTKNEDSP